MRTPIDVRTFAIAGVLLMTAASPMALAQDQSATPPSAENSSSHSGTAPDGMGSSGWTGGTGGSHIGKSAETTGAAQKQDAAGQPEMATGEDLKGPPMRFPANNTPE